jgi:hypothetical protein
MDPVHRLFRRLASEVARAPAADGPLTIGDIYQRLVPYRLVRSELGFSELKEYEHALLRLLAGEHALVEVRGEAAVDEFRRELASPNPILGIYRDYSDVQVTPRADATDPLPAPPAAVANATPVAHPPPPASPDPVDRTLAFEEGSPHRGAEASIPDRTAEAPAAESFSESSVRRERCCWACAEPLPSDREPRFCPQCGAAQISVPCGACGEPLVPSWRFCAGCGRDRRHPHTPG